MKFGLPADRRNTDTVAVAGDATHDTVDNRRHSIRGGVTEAKVVRERDRTSAHREDVAEDSADTGGGALIGLDETGMIVTLHLEGHTLAATEIDDAGIFAKTLENALRTRLEFFEMNS